MQIAKSPIFSSKDDDLDRRSIASRATKELERPPSPSPSFSAPAESTPSPEEEELRQKLLEVVATPRPRSPLILTSRILSPELLAIKSTQASLELEEDREIAEYAKRIADRLEEAIQKSPFINKDNLATPRSTIFEGSPKTLSYPPSPNPHRLSASKHHASKPSSRASTPRLKNHPEEDEVLLIPGAFTTPKSEALTTAALDKLNQRSPRISLGTRSINVPCTALPPAPAHVTAGYQTPSRRSEKSRISGSQQKTRFSPHGTPHSPLFS
ncbi:hypothetical protein BY996DRAFT_816432 [Phakopsora pachyrhizi]|nr:hypothetical protein BY996DRAFT_816432 [Phakopsora pachyrhizi]